MKYILHIIGNHNASSSFVNQIAKVYPYNNIVIKINDNDKVIEVSKDGNQYRFDDYNKFNRLFDISLISVIIVHYLDFSKERFIKHCLNKNTPIIWWMYGQDLYSRLYLKGYNLYAPQTLQFVHYRARNPITYLRHLRFEWRKHRLDKRIFKQIVGVIPCEMPDYELACSLLNRKVDLVDIYTRSFVANDAFSYGNDICIGHSASLTGNHLYAFDHLKGICLKNSEIWMPLSYTVQSEQYRQFVVNTYKREYGDKVHFIFDFQDLETYRANFAKYKVAIYTTWRQEALNNIFTCFQLGIKVYLSKYNPCYKFFKSQGYILYAIEDLACTDELTPLTQEEKIHNRQLFRQIKAQRDEISHSNIRDYFAKYM